MSFFLSYGRYIFVSLPLSLGNGGHLQKRNWQKVLMILNSEEFLVKSSREKCSTFTAFKYWHVYMHSLWQADTKIAHWIEKCTRNMSLYCVDIKAIL